jgi:hypothetical protein
VFITRKSASEKRLPHAWPCCRVLGQDGDLGGEGFHFLLPVPFQWPLETGYQDLAFGLLNQTPFLQSFVHDTWRPCLWVPRLCACGLHSNGVLLRIPKALPLRVPSASFSALAQGVGGEHGMEDLSGSDLARFVMDRLAGSAGLFGCQHQLLPVNVPQADVRQGGR